MPLKYEYGPNSRSDTWQVCLIYVGKIVLQKGMKVGSNTYSTVLKELLLILLSLMPVIIVPSTWHTILGPCTFSIVLPRVLELYYMRRY